MENHNENQDMNIQPVDASYYLDPYYNLDPYEKNPYCDHAPYPKSVPRKEPIRMLGQNASVGYPNQMVSGGPGYPNQMPNGGIVYPNEVSYEEREAQKKARASRNAADNSLILGIVSIIFGITILVGLVCGGLGVYMALKSCNMFQEKVRGNAVVGLICSIIGLLIAFAFLF